MDAHYYVFDISCGGGKKLLFPIGIRIAEIFQGMVYAICRREKKLALEKHYPIRNTIREPRASLEYKLGLEGYRNIIHYSLDVISGDGFSIYS
jgi:hypothetical protein